MSASLFIYPIILAFISICNCETSRFRLKRQIVFEDNDRRDRVPSSSDCLTPQRQRGQCIRWTQCGPLNHITRWDRVRPYACGFAGSEPRVCCPLLDSDYDEGPDVSFSTTTRRPPPRRTTRRVTTTTRRPVFTTTTTRRPVTTTTRRPLTTTTKRTGSVGLVPRFLPERCGESLNSTARRVVGGQEAERGAWPWMSVVYVQKRNGALSADCGGALVTSRHVITAAHCVVSGRGSTTISPRLLSVRLGAHNIRNTEPEAVQIGVDAVRRHERFDSRTYKNDIAVLRLNQEAPFTNRIKPVCLPYDVNFSQEELTDKTSTVVGYGTTAFNGRASDVLMEATFDIQSQETCISSYQKEVNITMEYMCAGTVDGSKDSCQGDSGGPLVTLRPGGGRFYLVGVVSFGKLCGQPNYPGVYTRVTRYLDWLRTNLDD